MRVCFCMVGLWFAWVCLHMYAPSTLALHVCFRMSMYNGEAMHSLPWSWPRCNTAMRLCLISRIPANFSFVLFDCFGHWELLLLPHSTPATYSRVLYLTCMLVCGLQSLYFMRRTLYCVMCCRQAKLHDTIFISCLKFNRTH